jgi:hypothetical protein
MLLRNKTAIVHPDELSPTLVRRVNHQGRGDILVYHIARAAPWNAVITVILITVARPEPLGNFSTFYAAA